MLTREISAGEKLSGCSTCGSATHLFLFFLFKVFKRRWQAKIKNRVTHEGGCVYMCTNPSYCYDLACNSSLMRYKVQSSNKLNAIRGASRWFEGEYTLLSLFHFEVWKRKKTSLFIIIKRQHRTQRSIIKAWIVRYNKSFGLTKRWH